MSQDITVELTINGQKVKKTIPSDKALADFLHEEMNLTGTKVCCALGVCKACTIAYQEEEGGILKSAQACITPAKSMHGFHIKTVEGLCKDGRLSPLQEAFLKNFSFQCGYSAPGFLMGATVLLDQLKRKPIHTDKIPEAIEEALGEHMCRCTGYVKYYAAIHEVILESRGLTLEGSK